MLMEEGVIERQRKKACQDMGNCLIGDLAFIYESSVHGLSGEGDIIFKIKQTRLEKLIFGNKSVQFFQCLSKKYQIRHAFLIYNNKLTNNTNYDIIVV